MKRKSCFFRAAIMALFLSVIASPLFATVYLPHTGGLGEFNTPFTNLYMPPGFVKVNQRLNRGNYFIIHNNGWAANTSWSGGVLFTGAGQYGIVTNLPRRDQGNTNWCRIQTPFPNTGLGRLTVISTTNPAATTEKFGVLYTTAAPRYITASSNDITNTYASANSNVLIYIRLSGTLTSAAEYILTRWTTNNWTNSYFVKAAATTAPTYTNSIPAVGSGRLVQYYVVTTAEQGSNFITNADHDYVTMSCMSNESTPFHYYTAGPYHQVGVDGTNDFNTNDVERFLTTTEGYTNWITWDSNYIYLGFYGQDIGSGSSSKVLYVYFSTNTNTNNTAGTAYAQVEGGQFPVLPFRANYFFRKTMAGAWSTGVWTNSAWNTNVSPLTAGSSNALSGDFLELRIHRTNFQNGTTINLTNLFVLSYLMDVSSSSSNTYAGCPADTFVDGYRANPSNYVNFTRAIWISNMKPSSNIYVTNDVYAPSSNYVMTPTNNQTNYIGDIIVLSNFTRDETGIYKIEVYSEMFGLYDTIWMTNTNAVYAMNIDTADFVEGEQKFFTVAYDTRHSLVSQTVTVYLKYSGMVYMPGTWNMGQYNTPFTNLYMPPGFVKRREAAQLNDNLLIHYDGWNTNTSWSAGMVFSDYQRTWTISRNDQGNTNWARLGGTFPSSTHYLTVVSSAIPSGTSQKFGILYTTGIPSRITEVTADPAAFANSNYTVDITLNVAKSSMERIVVRYSTNGWTNSMVVEATGTDTAYTALIPPMRSGAYVRYYVMNTTASDLYITNGDHNYVTLACFSNQLQPFSYYVSGTYHTVRIDGTNDFNTNDSEMLLATTSGYTNWISWDTDYLYYGYFGDALNDNNADKLLYVYFGTNTNAVTNLNLITGSAYGEPQGGQYPVLPFNANYFFRYATSGAWDTAVWTNNTWNSNVSPLDAGLSNVLNGRYFEMRIPKTNFNSSLNLNVMTFLLDKVSGSEKIYGGVPNDAFADGNRANPSNYLSYRGVLCVSNIFPSSAQYRTNDSVMPHTNALLWPTNGQSFSVGTPVTMTNFARDENGIYKIEFYTNVGGLYTNVYVTNTNGFFTMNLDTSNFTGDTFSFYTIAYDTKNACSSPTNQVGFNFTGFVYMPHTGALGQFDTLFTNLDMPPGFVKRTEYMIRGDYLMIHRDGWNSDSSWSDGTLLNAFQQTWEIPRWDQGNTNWARLRWPYPNSYNYLIVVAYANPSATTEKFGFMYTTAEPITITAVSGNERAYANSNYTVNITLSGAKTAAERIIVRYSTNDWVSAMTVTATGAGTAYTAQIPAMTSGSLVRYYVMTTTAADTYLTNGDHNYVTISCFSNESSPFMYYVSGTLHTIAMDGTNDFNTNDAEMLLTSTSGYTNWLTWDSSNFYFGYFGEDISANDSNKMLYVYLGTNTNYVTNLNLITGSAYGEPQETQYPVLPFNANYFVRYLTTHYWETAVWTNNSWRTNNSPLASGIDVQRSGNYLEMKIPRTNFMNLTAASFTNLNVLTFMLDKSSINEQIYGAVPGNSFLDGYQANPSNYLRYGAMMWVSNIMPSTNIYVTNDAVSPYTNRLLTPVSFLTNYVGDVITLSNFARDNTGIYKVEVYTNTNAYFDTIWVTNTNAVYTYGISTMDFGSGVYNVYTLAYDTYNVRSSQTNTNIMLRTGANMSIYKSISSIQLLSTNLLKPGALITYQIIFTNTGPFSGSNVVIYDQIPDHTTYFTNYLGTASGWTAQYAHIANPDQSYDSMDYDLNPASATWFRWIKQAVQTSESGSSLFFGVTVD